jgi:hypothetical protein
MKILQSKETFVAPGFDEQNLVKSPQTVQKYQLITWWNPDGLPDLQSQVISRWSESYWSRFLGDLGFWTLTDMVYATYADSHLAYAPSSNFALDMGII